MEPQKYLIELSMFQLALMVFFSFANPMPASAQMSSSAVKYKWERGQQHEYKFKVNYEMDGDKRELTGKAKYELHQKDVSKDLANSDLEKFEEGESTSTAFAVSADGYLLTCAHCIRGATAISITVGGEKKRARLIDANYEQDLALLKIEASKLPFVSLGKDTPVELAQDVRAIGYPLSDVLGSSVKIARGSIAGFIDRGGAFPNLQLDVAVNFGNSGGPLVDETGAVVGVVNAKLSGETIAKIGFAIPIKMACEMLDKNSVKYESTKRAQRLSGPELAKLVTPSVFFVHTKIGPGGENQQSNFRFSTNGKLSRPTNLGKSDETIASHVIMGADGSILDSENEVNLPLLLGIVGQMPFERLPAYTARSWAFNELYSLSLPKSTVRSRRSDPFGYMDPFAGRNPFGHMPGFRNHRSPADLHRELMDRVRGGGGFEEPETRLAPAKSTTNYKILKQNKTLVTISKKFSLETVDDSSEYASMKMSFESELVFDTKLGMFVKQQAHGKLDVRLGEEQTKIPFEMTYDKIDSNGRVAIAKSGQQSDSRHSVASAKQQYGVLPEAGLTDDQIERLLNHESQLLESSELFAYLNRLAKWNEAKKQKAEIEAMLNRLADAESPSMRKLAIDALLNWNPVAATPHIIVGIRNANRFSRRSWIIKLGRTGDPKAAIVLCEQLLDPGARKYAQRALMELGPQGEIAVIETLQQNYKDSEVANACLEFLSKHGTLVAAGIIRELSKQEDWKIRSKGESTLREILARQ